VSNPRALRPQPPGGPPGEVLDGEEAERAYEAASRGRKAVSEWIVQRLVERLDEAVDREHPEPRLTGEPTVAITNESDDRGEHDLRAPADQSVDHEALPARSSGTRGVDTLLVRGLDSLRDLSRRGRASSPEEIRQ
jgi:hypothetical protein